jgi:hypothetical protein
MILVWIGALGYDGMIGAVCSELGLHIVDRSTNNANITTQRLSPGCTCKPKIPNTC